MKPCSQCPFSKTVEPGALGGSPVSTYLGQAAGPFMLHCHQGRGYSPEASRQKLDLAQCAGAAIYRANTGVAEFLPKPLLRLPASDDAFPTPEALVSHHCRISPGRAAEILHYIPVSELVSYQLERATNSYHQVPS